MLTRFPAALRRFADRHGKDGLYHATITWALILLINERIERARFAGHPAAAFDQFAAANPDLLTWKPSILAHYYHDETLASDVASTTFLLPDRVLDSTSMVNSLRSYKSDRTPKAF